MRASSFPLVLVGVLVSVFALVGCGGERAINLHYQRPAAYEIPANIKRIGVAEFGGQTAEDRRWGNIASDKLAAVLHQANLKYKRYKLVDRKRLKAILDERDLQLFISDGASAGKAGKLANVDAMIYGSVSVSHRDERGLTRRVLDPFSRSLKTKKVRYTRRHCMATVNFTMDEISTGTTLIAENLSNEYDSETDKKAGGSGINKILGFGGDSLPPTDQVLAALIDTSVAEFIAKISPHEVVVTEKLQGGKSKIVGTGNKLAAADDYAGAMECYEAAVEAKPDDHGAVFNIGVMHEAMGNFDQAEDYYTRAFKIKPKERYVFARRRVRGESGK